MIKKIKEVLKQVWGILVEVNPFSKEAMEIRRINRQTCREQNIVEYYERPQEFKVRDTGKLQRHDGMADVYKFH